MEPYDVFFGDINGDKTIDLVAFYTIPSQGTATYKHILFFKGTKKGLRWMGSGKVFGSEPRDPKFGDGIFEYTALISGPNDGHCCPQTPVRFHARLGIGGKITVDFPENQ